MQENSKKEDKGDFPKQSDVGNNQKPRKKKIERVQSPGGTPEVMDIKELSGYLGIGKSKIYALIRGKKIPASRIGRQYRFYKGLVDKWLQEKLITQGEGDMPLFKKS